MCSVLLVWANVAQYKRLKPLYPDYNRYLKEEGGRMVAAKQQELMDVTRYNGMVRAMRQDVTKH